VLPASVISQNMSVQLDVNSQVETMVEQSLDFGQLIAGSGFQEIPLGSPSMGIFEVRALRTQQLMITLDADSTLRHSDPAVSDVIFMNLNASYTDNGINDYRLSLPFSDIVETVILQSPPQNPDAVWSSIYIYVFGNIDLGFVPAGVYRGEITLTVIYD
jgi:hypothetical protein